MTLTKQEYNLICELVERELRDLKNRSFTEGKERVHFNRPYEKLSLTFKNWNSKSICIREIALDKSENKHVHKVCRFKNFTFHGLYRDGDYLTFYVEKL